MKTVRSLYQFIVALFVACFSWVAQPDRHGVDSAPPTNNATLQLENLALTFKRAVARQVVLFQLTLNRALGGFSIPVFGLAIEASLEERIAKSLDEMGTRFKQLDDLQKSGKTTDETVQKTVRTLEEIQTELQEMKRQRLMGLAGSGPRIRIPGRVSDECAKHLAAQFILHCERSNKLEALAESGERRTALLGVARGILGIQGKAALTTGDIPLPTTFSGELRELISEFGVARRKMMPYPIGMGTARPPRMGTRPAFGSIAMSAAIDEKVPTITFASLESHKIGGLVRLPREIDEQSIVPMGQFLARYGAIEFARAEDTWAFLADGSGTYENVSGIVKIATDNNKSVVLAAATGPHDATLANFRALRTKVNKAVLSGRFGAYYLDSTWETQLPTFKTEADPFAYVRNPDGSATLDGYPIVWTDVLEPFGTADVTSKPLAVFGALDFWLFGEHGSPRIDTSEHVFFANDQLATRFIEEVDFDYLALDAAAVLLTGAAA